MEEASEKVNLLKGRLKHVDSRILPLSLNKLVRTGTPPERG